MSKTEVQTRFDRPGHDCPVCNTHTKGCSLLVDGLHLCRIDTNSPGEEWKFLGRDEHGFGRFRRRDETKPRKGGKSKASGPSAANEKIAADAAAWAANLNANWKYAEGLGTLLGGIPDSIFRLFQLGLNGTIYYGPETPELHDQVGGKFTIPERTGAGLIVGCATRFEFKNRTLQVDGKPVTSVKKSELGHERGLTIPDGWMDRPGPLFLVEGFTNTAAMTACGLPCVGRPGNMAGVEYLAELLADWPEDRQIVVVGDYDEKNGKNGQPEKKHPDGKYIWPGKEGAKHVSGELAARLGRKVLWTLPPDGAKDVRVWLTSRAEEWPDRGVKIAAGLISGAVEGEAKADDFQPNDSPDNPHRLVQGYLKSILANDELKLRSWRGEFIEWSNGAYSVVEDDEIRGRLTSWTRAEFIRLNRIAMEKADGEDVPKTINVSRRLVSDVANALHGAILLPSSIEPPQWIDGDGPQPNELLAMKNGIFDLATMKLTPPTPRFFTFSAVPFKYMPDKALPSNWLKFLADIWPNDHQNIDTLQEMFGYLLTQDTAQQKIFFLIGPKRSGKGTILRVLTELLGENNVASPTLGSLASDFGLSPLLGKSAAIIADARLDSRADISTIAERLLSISGEDFQSVNRKHKSIVTTKIRARFVLASNLLPKMSDASGALVSRFIMLQFTKTFYGHEDHQLFAKLKPELPAILNWAIAGLHRLRERGKFVQPESASDMLQEFEDLASPINKFLRECCYVAANATSSCKELWERWKAWCEEDGKSHVSTNSVFGRDLKYAIPGLVRIRVGSDFNREWVYHGVRILGKEESNDVKNNNHKPHHDTKQKVADMDDLWRTS